MKWKQKKIQRYQLKVESETKHKRCNVMQIKDNEIYSILKFSFDISLFYFVRFNCSSLLIMTLISTLFQGKVGMKKLLFPTHFSLL